jgi:O-antigen/teichoic acid export membrane protein
VKAGAAEVPRSGPPSMGPRVEPMARNAVFKAASQATRLLSMGFLILAARVLGPEGFGKFTVAYALATLLGAALDLGVPTVLTRRVARAPAAAAREWATAAVLKLAVLGPVGLVYALAPWLTHRPADTTLAVWLLGLAIALQAFIELSVAVFAARGSVRYELGVRLVEKGVLVATGVVGLWLGLGLAAVGGAFVVAALVSLSASVWVLHRWCAPFTGGWHAGRARALAREVGLVSLWFVVAFATTRLVPLIVAWLAGERAAGYLGAAIRVGDVLQVLPVAVTAAVYPVLARTAPTDPRFRELARQTTALLVLAVLPAVLVLVLGAPGLVAVVFGPRFAPSAPLVAAVAPAAGLEVLQFFLSALLLALDRPGRLLAVAAAGLAVSVVLTPVLVHAAGALGGAVALVSVSAVAVGGSLFALAPLVGLPVGSGVVKALGAAVGAAAGAWLARPDPGFRCGVALGLYVAFTLALRPLPAGLGRHLLRDLVGEPAPTPGPSRP